MTRSKNSSGSHRKINREEKPEPRPPYALCFYQSEKATGVVESSCVPDNAKLHATILVPEAISCRSEVPVNPLKRFKATLIKFGRKCKCILERFYHLIMSISLSLDFTKT